MWFMWFVEGLFECLFYQAHTLSFKCYCLSSSLVRLNSEILKYLFKFIFPLSINNTNLSCILASVEL